MQQILENKFQINDNPVIQGMIDTIQGRNLVSRIILNRKRPEVSDKYVISTINEYINKKNDTEPKKSLSDLLVMESYSTVICK